SQDFPGAGPGPGGPGRPARRRPRGRPVARTGGQAAAVNRSRPIYENTRPMRGRNRAGAVSRPARNGAAQRAPAREQAPLPSNPPEAGLRILHAVDTRSAFSDRLLEGAHERPDARGGVGERDQALLNELVKGTLRWRGRIDWALDRLVHIGLSQVQP